MIKTNKIQTSNGMSHLPYAKIEEPAICNRHCVERVSAATNDVRVNIYRSSSAVLPVLRTRDLSASFLSKDLTYDDMTEES